MTKEEFLKELEKELDFLTDLEKREVLQDQEEFIREAMSQGRSEQNVLDSLGSPRAFAEALRLEHKVKKIKEAPDTWSSVKESLTATGVLFGLMPLSLLILFGPGLVILSFMFSWFTLSLTVLFSASFCLLLSFFVFFFGFGVMEFLSVFFLSLGVLLGSLASLALLFSLVRFIVSLFVRFLNWNINLFKGRLV
jgi:uncharacterized membrane protein